MYFLEHYLIKNLFLNMELIELLWNKFQHQVLYLMKIQKKSFYKKSLWCGMFSSFLFLLFFLFSFTFDSIPNINLKNDFNRSCSFHPNVIKLIGYTLEPEFFIITKKYELDLFTFIHHPTEDLPPLLAMQLTK